MPQICAALQVEYPDFTRASIINTVAMYEAAGLLNAIRLSGGEKRIDIVTTPHAHFQCTECKEIKDIEIEEMDWKNMKAYGQGWATGMDITLYGLCKKCRMHS